MQRTACSVHYKSMLRHAIRCTLRSTQAVPLGSHCRIHFFLDITPQEEVKGGMSGDSVDHEIDLPLPTYLLQKVRSSSILTSRCLCGRVSSCWKKCRLTTKLCTIDFATLNSCEALRMDFWVLISNHSAMHCTFSSRCRSDTTMPLRH